MRVPGGHADVLAPHSFESLPLLKSPAVSGPKFATQTLPSPSMEVPHGPMIPPPVNLPRTVPVGDTAYTASSPCEVTHALPRESTDSPRSCCPNRCSRNFCCRTPFFSWYFARLFGKIPTSPLLIHTVPSGARAAPKGPLPPCSWNCMEWLGSPPGNTNTLSFPKLVIQMLPEGSATIPCARIGPP